MLRYLTIIVTLQLFALMAAQAATSQTTLGISINIVEKNIATVVSATAFTLYKDCKGVESTVKPAAAPGCSYSEKTMYKHVVSLPDKSTLGFIKDTKLEPGTPMIAEKDDQGNWKIH